MTAPNPPRIYVRLPNWVGDVVLATPFLGALRRCYPGATVVAHGKGRLFDVLDGGGLYDRKVALERRGGLLWPVLEGRRVAREAGPFDLAFLLPNSLSAAALARALGARRRIGYALNGRSLLLTDALPVKKEGRLRPIPMVEYYLGLLTALGHDVSAVPRRPVLPITAEARARVAALLERLGVRPGERLWAVNAGGAWETKRWPAEYLGQLVDLAAARGVKPFLLRGPDEGFLVEGARKHAKAPFLGGDVIVPLGDLAAFLERCELLVSTDSGPRHVGVAAGTPIVALVGPTHPAYTKVDHPRQRVLCEEVECWPCHLPVCPEDFRCMTRLVPEKVVRAAEELLAAPPAQGAAP